MDSGLLDFLSRNGVAIFAAALAAWTQLRLRALAAREQARAVDQARRIAELEKAEQRRHTTEAAMAAYREPLVRASFDLQSRIFNIQRLGFVDRFLAGGDAHERTYAIENTAFLFAQFFAWVEIIRVRVQFIDLVDDAETRRLTESLDEITRLVGADRNPRPFRIFAGEQRAIGEWMITEAGDRSVCLGYGAFLRRVAEAPDPLVDRLRNDAAGLVDTRADAGPRLVALQHRLVDLLDHLDPDGIRVPRASRGKL